MQSANMQPSLIPHELCLLTPGTAPCLIVVLVTLLSSSSHQTVVWVGVEPDALLGSSSVMKSRVKIATTALFSTINLLIPRASPSPFDVLAFPHFPAVLNTHSVRQETGQQRGSKVDARVGEWLPDTATSSCEVTASAASIHAE